MELILLDFQIKTERNSLIKEKIEDVFCLLDQLVTTKNK